MSKQWGKKPIGDVSTIFNGNSICAAKKKAEFLGVEDGIPYIATKDVGFDHVVDYDSGVRIPEEKSSDFKLAPAGSVLVCAEGGSAGRKIALTNENVHFGNKLFAVCSHEALDSRFVFYFCLSGSFVEQFKDAMAGLIGGVSIKKFKAISIDFPPLAEQQRIVGILDEAFAGIATVKAKAEQNLQNARALFESHLQSVFSQRGEGWVETTLGDVCGFQNGFAFKSSTFKPSGAPIIRISSIQDGRIDVDNRLVFFDPKDYRENLDRYRIVKDDLLIAMSGATTGKIGFNTESTVFYLNQRVGKFEPSNKLNKQFLYHYLSTKVEENLRISAGAAQPNLSTEQIKGFVLPLPPIEQQAYIVEALESLSTETRRLTAIYERKLAALEDLKKSLLHQAFQGEL